MRGRTEGRRRRRRGLTGGAHVYCMQVQPAWGGGGQGGGGRAEAPGQPAAPESRVSVCSRVDGRGGEESVWGEGDGIEEDGLERGGGGWRER